MNFKIYILCFFLCACTNAGQDSPSIETKTVDSTEEGLDLAQVRKDFISSYSNPIVIDTSFYWEDTLYKVKFTHYATMDSGLTVPSLYNFDTNKDFVTHNFKSKLFIIKDTDTILNQGDYKTNIQRVPETGTRFIRDTFVSQFLSPG